MPSSGIQTTTGKAFEYACLFSLSHRIESFCSVSIVNNLPLITAINAFHSLDVETRDRYLRGAEAAVNGIMQLEPRLTDNNNEFTISLQSDSAGQTGDVRDVVCVQSNGWELGISCKHNHEAVKHSRLSDKIDFCKDWFGYDCSDEYFERVRNVFTPLRNLRDESIMSGRPVLWQEIDNKEESCYVPVLNAFMDELRRIDRQYPETVPEQLIHYLIGYDDFYKVIMNENDGYTKIEAININETLNNSYGVHRSAINVPRLRLPRRFVSIGFRADSKNTIEIYCDNGWSVSMRIHNASSRVEPSLKFDVQLMAMPSNMYVNYIQWR